MLNVARNLMIKLLIKFTKRTLTYKHINFHTTEVVDSFIFKQQFYTFIVFWKFFYTKRTNSEKINQKFFLFEDPSLSNRARIENKNFLQLMSS